MKTKLLKKVRSRYSITYYPKGVIIGNTFLEGPITALGDSKDSWRIKYTFLPKQEAYVELYSVLVKWIRKDYSPYMKSKPGISEQLWYKK